MTSPLIEVGILFSPTIKFRLNGRYTLQATGEKYTGEFLLKKCGNTYRLNSTTGRASINLPAIFIPEDYETTSFDLTDVVIGIHFHWERTEDQRFKGSLKIIDETEHLTAIDILPVEDYLASVISSEMNAHSPLELLKAHAVISRSWLLAQKEKANRIPSEYSSCRQTETEYIQWFDREDHTYFDVCADDHCQRYQGISRAYTPAVQEAIEATSGEILCYERQICDTRFSKCCGGITERFENVWEAVPHPYLEKRPDRPGIRQTDEPTDSIPDLTREEEARKWILDSPEAFCNTTDTRILAQVLNDYDQETRHFFRWQVQYTAEEISVLIHKRLGIDFGTVTDLIPVERGVSGRIVRLKIIGTRKTLTIGKELIIRKALSDSHLYSSAFVVDKTAEGFVLHGAGWGHGVGLCQIGAAVMADKGFGYKEILAHYFKDSQLIKRY